MFGHDPRVYQTTVKEFYKNEAGQVCGALIAKLESRVVDGRPPMMVPTGEEFCRGVRSGADRRGFHRAASPMSPKPSAWI